MASSKLERSAPARRLRAPGLFFLAFCAIGGPAAAISTFACSSPASAAPAKAKAPLWKEGKGRPVTGSASYDPRISLAPMLEKVTPTVVSIQASGRTRAGVFGQSIRTGGIGSGFIIRADGLVVTNAHVVANHDTFRVELSDGRMYDAKVVGTDAQTDVALLQLVGAEKLPVATLGKSKPVAVGDWVVAVGSPLGLEQSVTRGIVSAKGRGSLGLYADGYADFLQTDAAISPGNSGGPLFNLDGEVVGMNTAVAGMGNGLGFAVPVDQIKRVVRPLYTDGRVQRGWLGISGSDVEPAATGVAPRRGALVAQVHPDGPGARAGLRRGDLIVDIEGERVSDFDDLRSRIGDFDPSQSVRLELLRDGKRKTLQVKLGERPAPSQLARMGGEFAPSAPTAKPKAPPSPGVEGKSPPRAKKEAKPDARSKAPTPGQPPRLDIEVREVEGGLRIERVQAGGLGARLGLQPGDVLTGVNGRRIQSTREVQEALEASPGAVSISARRGRGTISSSILGGL